MSNAYRAEDIEVLEGLEPVRKRPGMYIAGTDTPAGLHQLALEILDNSVDEAMNGHASIIRMTLHEDGTSITVEDNGRGIPVEKHPKFGKSALELILTTLHAGGKFSSNNYQTSGGLHGVGSSVVNALSEELIATVYRGGRCYEQSFCRGLPTGRMKSKAHDELHRTGTTIFFRPDKEIFSTINFSSRILRQAIETKAYLNPGLRLVFNDETKEKEEEFFYQEGLAAYLKQLLIDRKEQAVGDEIFIISRTEEISIDVALVWTENTREDFQCYANGIYTVDGGSHEAGAKNGIVKAIKNYVSVHSLLPKGLKITAEDIREGVLCLLSVKLPSDRYQAQYQGQTKSKLNNPEVTPLVEAAFKQLEKLLNEKPSVGQAVANRIVLAAKARAASRQASQAVKRKIGISHRLTLPGKLADCSSTKPLESELFIVEGDSAGGSTKQARDRNYQAVLPLRGKILNTISSASSKVIDNKELGNVISALGCGVGASLRAEKLRYGKVIILTDADADGMHIATLLIGFFFKFMRPLIDGGHIYLGKPPLYGVFPKGSTSQTKVTQEATVSASKKTTKGSKAKSKSSTHWAYSDQELDKILTGKNKESSRIVRYKGLGEMNPSTLWDTTLDPQTRTLLRIRAHDAQLGEQILEELMGNDASCRNRLIQENAHLLEVDV